MTDHEGVLDELHHLHRRLWDIWQIISMGYGPKIAGRAMVMRRELEKLRNEIQEHGEPQGFEVERLRTVLEDKETAPRAASRYRG